MEDWSANKAFQHQNFLLHDKVRQALAVFSLLGLFLQIPSTHQLGHALQHYPKISCISEVAQQIQNIPIKAGSQTVTLMACPNLRRVMFDMLWYNKK